MVKAPFSLTLGSGSLFSGKPYHGFHHSTHPWPLLYGRVPDDFALLC